MPQLESREIQHLQSIVKFVRIGSVIYYDDVNTNHTRILLEMRSKGIEGNVDDAGFMTEKKEKKIGIWGLSTSLEVGEDDAKRDKTVEILQEIAGDGWYIEKMTND